MSTCARPHPYAYIFYSHTGIRGTKLNPRWHVIMSRRIREIVLRAQDTTAWREIGRLDGKVATRKVDLLFGVDITVSDTGFHVNFELISQLTPDECAIMRELVSLLSYSHCDFDLKDITAWAHEAAEKVRLVSARRAVTKIMDELMEGATIDGETYYVYDLVLFKPVVTKKMLPAALATVKHAGVLVNTCKSIYVLKKRVIDFLKHDNDHFLTYFARNPRFPVEKCTGFGAECAELARKLVPEIDPGTIKILRNGQ